jgi:hypothetical protein
MSYSSRVIILYKYFLEDSEVYGERVFRYIDANNGPSLAKFNKSTIEGKVGGIRVAKVPNEKKKKLEREREREMVKGQCRASRGE